MPTAQARMTDDGGPYLTSANKPIAVAGGSVIALSSADTSFWTQQRWEIYAYPEGWTAPAGWSTDANGVIYSTSVTPSSFTLPANTTLWGKWGIRLTVNNGMTNNVADPAMVDDTLAFEVLSQTGLHDLMKYESNQFGDDWTEQQRANLRAMDTLTVGDGVIQTRYGTVTTNDATATVVASFPVINAGVMTFDFCVVASRDSSATKGGRWKGSTTYRIVAGTPTLIGSADYATAHETDAGMDVAFNLNVATVEVKVTGVASNTINWFCELRVQQIAA